MDDVIVGLLAIGLGLAVCFLGLRIWYFMLPIWGFVSGFFVGAATVTAIFGDGFLSTVTGWIVGIVVGLGFALLSYLFWYAGVMLAAASVGGLLASGFLDAVGIDGKWVVFLISLAAALALAFLALVIALPVYIVIISTGIVGAEPGYRWRRTTQIRQVVFVYINRRWLPHLVQANGFRACRRRRQIDRAGH